MTPRRLLTLFLMLLAISASVADGRQHRSSKAVKEFRGENPCPATGESKGSCKGYIIDHVIPLCAGGVDQPSNMQWQTVMDAKVKDKLEWEQCRKMRRKE